MSRLLVCPRGKMGPGGLSNSQQLRVPLRADLAASSGRCRKIEKVKTYRHEYSYDTPLCLRGMVHSIRVKQVTKSCKHVVCVF